MKITTLVPWYGSNRMLAHKVGELLSGCSWVGVPFAGGMSELRHIKARTVLVSDLHRHVLNLAEVVADESLCHSLRNRLDAAPFHPDMLQKSQTRLRTIEAEPMPDPDKLDRLYWAVDYFIASWMGRNGKAGTGEEFKAGMSVRWEAGGGDSATRYRNAVESLREWQAVLARCTFVCLDVFDFLAKVKDRERHGLYLDPPFPDVGDEYKHKFTERDHRQLAVSLATFSRTRVVCRFYDHPLVQELYASKFGWTWHRPEGGKTQTNKAAPEVLLVRN